MKNFKLTSFSGSGFFSSIKISVRKSFLIFNFQELPQRRSVSPIKSDVSPSGYFGAHQLTPTAASRTDTDIIPRYLARSEGTGARHFLQILISFVHQKARTSNCNLITFCLLLHSKEIELLYQGMKRPCDSGNSFGGIPVKM